MPRYTYRSDAHQKIFGAKASTGDSNPYSETDDDKSQDREGDSDSQNCSGEASRLYGVPCSHGVSHGGDSVEMRALQLSGAVPLCRTLQLSRAAGDREYFKSGKEESL